jgi:hypothetical protein
MIPLCILRVVAESFKASCVDERSEDNRCADIHACWMQVLPHTRRKHTQTSYGSISQSSTGCCEERLSPVRRSTTRLCDEQRAHPFVGKQNSKLPLPPELSRAKLISAALLASVHARAHGIEPTMMDQQMATLTACTDGV